MSRLALGRFKHTPDLDAVGDVDLSGLMESYVTDGVQILRREWATLRAEMGRPRTCPDMFGSRYTQ